ncbi:MAG TPA: NAD(P)-binding domain-containing protein [Usitatibacter sp.]|nr:NAD(P)-binding domain-containing protein [Usitatibacter sp.]
MTRRIFAVLCAGFTLAMAFAAPAAEVPTVKKIGIIGSGRIGGTLGELWAKQGYDVMFSSLDLAHDKELAAKTGAKAGTPAEAAAFGDVLLVSVPYPALAQIGRDYAASIKGKVVLDTSNPIQARDGDMAIAAREKGTGTASAELLPGARLVRAFNCVGYSKLQSEHHRSGDRIAIPLAGDDIGAVDVAKRLVRDAGFEPVLVGGLPAAKRFDVGTPVFGKALTAAELRKALDLPPQQ